MAGRGSSPVLVGRAEEMAALADALFGVREGGHPALLIGGAARVISPIPRHLDATGILLKMV